MDIIRGGKSKSWGVNPYVHLMHSKENKNARTESELIRSGAFNIHHHFQFPLMALESVCLQSMFQKMS